MRHEALLEGGAFVICFQNLNGIYYSSEKYGKTYSYPFIQIITPDCQPPDSNIKTG